MDLAIDQKSAASSSSKGLRLASLGLKPVTSLATQKPLLYHRTCGCIVTEAGQFKAVYGRWWPHLGNWMQIVWDVHFQTMPQDRCELYFHQPSGCRNFIALSYVRSGPATSAATGYVGLLVLDYIAKIKRTDAMVANVTNNRISDRLLTRFGWETHCHDWPGRHVIRRFYGSYPGLESKWLPRLGLATAQGI